jgi:hypothetical protein
MVKFEEGWLNLDKFKTPFIFEFFRLNLERV